MHYYFFDFDGTLTKRDTMFAFLKFHNKKRFYLSFLIHLPVFILLKFRVMQAQAVKESFINAVLSSEKKEDIQASAQRFCNLYFEKILRPQAVEWIQKTLSEGHPCVMVTASLDVWALPFADRLNMELIATEARFENGIYCKNFQSKNCNGAEKVNRISRFLSQRGITPEKTTAFGDTGGDREMLEWADESFYQYFS